VQIDLKKNIAVFSRLGEQLQAISTGRVNPETERVIEAASATNPWFTRESILASLGAIGQSLTQSNLERWIAPYRAKMNSGKEKKAGVINAGNIPAVGFHDFLSVLISGNIYEGKNSSDDAHLIPHIASLLKTIEPAFEERIFFVSKIASPDMVIATGSNNSARYFEYYFGKYPHIIRKNRNGVAVLTGSESSEELLKLADDVFQYFGLGCRNVSKLYLPQGYDLSRLFRTFEKYSNVLLHNRYMNNYTYQRVVMLMNKEKFLENGFVILKESTSLHSPVAVLHYEYYKDVKDVFEKLASIENEIQCIACSDETRKKFSEGELSLIPLGQTQKPMLWDYADGVDTMEFLLGVK
jgi:hypothetical protein